MPYMLKNNFYLAAIHPQVFGKTLKNNSYFAAIPPSSGITAPVIKSDACDAR